MIPWNRQGYAGGPMLVIVACKFFPADERYDADRDCEVSNVDPPCPGQDSCALAGGRLCNACWLEELVKQVGIETVLLEDVEMPDTDCAVVLRGHMWSDYREDHWSGGWDGEEGFEVESVEVMPL